SQRRLLHVFTGAQRNLKCSLLGDTVLISHAGQQKDSRSVDEVRFQKRNVISSAVFSSPAFDRSHHDRVHQNRSRRGIPKSRGAGSEPHLRSTGDLAASVHLGVRWPAEG